MPLNFEEIDKRLVPKPRPQGLNFAEIDKREVPAQSRPKLNFAEIDKRTAKPYEAQPFKTNFMSWMDRLMRPAYASAGFAKELVETEGAFEPGKAIWKGLTGQEKTTYSNVLETTGWRPTTKIGKFARGVTGFGLDVLLDPTTYVGVGGLTKAGRVASKTGKLATTIGKQATKGQRALLSFAGMPLIKGASVLKGLGKAGVAARAIPGVEKLGKAFVPGFRPVGVNPNVWNQFQKVKRGAEAIKRVGDEKAMKFATGILDDMKGLVKAGKLSDDGVKQLLHTVEKRSLSAALPDSVQGIYKKLVTYADEITEKRAGMGKTLLDEADYDYWLHHLLPDADQKTLKRLGIDRTLRDWTTTSGSDLYRKYIKLTDPNGAESVIKRVAKTQQEDLLKQGYKIEQATGPEINKALGKDIFSTDIPFTSYVMGKRVSKQQAGMDFFTNIRELGFDTQRPGTFETGIPELKGVFFEEGLVKEIKKTGDVFVKNELASDFAQTFDAIQNYWKKWTLGPFPAYHVRNMVGNVWNNYLSGVVNPKVYMEAAGIQRSIAKGKYPKGSIGGKSIKKIIERAEALGVLERGWFGTVLGTEGAPRFYKEAKRLGKKIADVGLVPAEKGLKVGKMIENNARLAHFLDKVKKGWNYDEAALSVKKYLFDYHEITPIEANVMRRLMPFYTWSRKNIPLQMEHIIKAPGKTAVPVAKAQRALAGGTEEERKYLPKWLKERMAMRVGKPEDGVSRYFPLESWLPIADVAKLRRPGQAMTELLSPAVKVPIELLMNKSFYFDKPIERYPGEKKKVLGVPVSAKQEHILRSVRIVNELNRLFEKPKPTAFEATKADKYLRLLTGIKTYPQKIVEMKRWARYRIDKQLFELKKAYNRARVNGDSREMKNIIKTIQTLNKIDTNE